MIFKPGFSTAENVSSTSGRGVGMDVVEKNIALLGGKIEIFSEKNRGTNISILIPGAVSTEECIILKDLPTFYAVPSRSVQWVKNKSDLETDIVTGTEHIRYNKSQIPIQDLSKLLSLPSNNSEGFVEKIRRIESMISKKNLPLKEEISLRKSIHRYIVAKKNRSSGWPSA